MMCVHDCLPGEPCRANPCPALAGARAQRGRDLAAQTMNADAFRERLLHTEGPLTAALDCLYGEGVWSEQEADALGDAILAALEQAIDDKARPPRATAATRPVDSPVAESDPVDAEPEMCLRWGPPAAPTFTPVCTLPAGHDGECNWAERVALRDHARAEAAARRHQNATSAEAWDA